MKVEIIKQEDFQRSGDMPIKVTTCGNVIELMEMSKVNRKGSSIVKIDEDHYVNAKDFDVSTGEITGEIKEFQRTDNRAQNLNGLAKSMKMVRDLINCNVSDPTHCRWMCFTYAESMTDPKRLYRDRQVFWQRVVRWHLKHGYSIPEYIAIVEPQGDGKKYGNEWHAGTWHLHEVWVYPEKAPYLPNDEMARLWSNGFVTVKKIDDVDNVGAYITAYLCDVPLEDADKYNIDPKHFKLKDAEIKQEDGTIQTKKYIKGGRLHLYPNKMNFYRTSRGVKRPMVEWMKAEKAKEKAKAGTLTYSKTIRLSDSDDFTNDIHYEYYNTVRGKSQDLEDEK